MNVLQVASVTLPSLLLSVKSFLINNNNNKIKNMKKIIFILPLYFFQSYLLFFNPILRKYRKNNSNVRR